MTEPGSRSDGDVADELTAIRSRLLALRSLGKGREVAQELIEIRARLRDLAEDNEEIRRQLGASDPSANG